MLKRAGRAFDSRGVEGTLPGELAVECPACPRPGVNLPDGWEDVPEGQKCAGFIYLFIMTLIYEQISICPYLGS
jgi:hypothetical protein